MTNEQKLREALQAMLTAYEKDQYRGWEKGFPQWNRAVKQAREALSLQPPTSDEGTPSETPLTDAQVIQASELCYSQVVVANFARQLERTLHAKERELETLRKDIETGFMEGAYARLKTLQTAEQEALQSVLAAPQEGKTVDPSDFSMGDPHPCDVSRAAPATPRGDGGEREGFYEKLWKDFVSLQSGDVQKICEEAELYRRSLATPPATTDGMVPDDVIKRVRRRIEHVMADAKRLPDAKVKLFVSDVEHLLATAIQSYDVVIVPKSKLQSWIDAIRHRNEIERDVCEDYVLLEMERLAAAPQSGKKEDDVCRVTLEPHRWRFTLAGGAVCRDCNSPPAPSSPPSKAEGE